MRSQGISQFHLQTPRASANGINHYLGGITYLPLPKLGDVMWTFEMVCQQKKILYS